MCPDCGYLLWHEKEGGRIRSLGKYIGAIAIIIIVLGFTYAYLYSDDACCNDVDDRSVVPAGVSSYTFMGSDVLGMYAEEGIDPLTYMMELPPEYMDVVGSLSMFGYFSDMPEFAYVLEITDKPVMESLLLGVQTTGMTDYKGVIVNELGDGLGYAWIGSTLVVGDISPIENAVDTAKGDSDALADSTDFAAAMAAMPETDSFQYLDANEMEWSLLPEFSDFSIPVDQVSYIVSGSNIESGMAMLLGMESNAAAALAQTGMEMLLEASSTAHEGVSGTPITYTVSREGMAVLMYIEMPGDHPNYSFSDLFS